MYLPANGRLPKALFGADFCAIFAAVGYCGNLGEGSLAFVNAPAFIRWLKTFSYSQINFVTLIFNSICNLLCLPCDCFNSATKTKLGATAHHDEMFGRLPPFI